MSPCPPESKHQGPGGRMHRGLEWVLGSGVGQWGVGRASRNFLPHGGHPVPDLGGPAPLCPWPLLEGGLHAPGPNPPAAPGLTSWAPSSLLLVRWAGALAPGDGW